MNICHRYVPTETLASIFSILQISYSDQGSKDLQSARLVCKAFNDAASPYLIPKAWISVNPRDWERLTEIANHRIFSRHVTEIVYDARLHGRSLLQRSRYIKALGTGNKSSAPILKILPNDLDKTVVKYSRAAVLRGYEEYTKRYHQEHELEKYRGEHMNCWLNGPWVFGESIEDYGIDYIRDRLPGDLVCLVRALPSMTRVQRMRVSSKARKGPSHHWIQLPNTRSSICMSFTIENAGVSGQDRVIVDPQPCQSWDDERQIALVLPSHQDLMWYRGFHVLAQAASMVKMSTLTAFSASDCGSGGQTGIEHRCFQMSCSQLLHAGNAFRTLTEIDLRLERSYRHVDQDLIETISGGDIAHCLIAAQSLKRLALGFDLERTPVPNLDSVIGSTTWSQLHTVSLKNMEVRQAQFVAFLLRHKATLRSLNLHGMSLMAHDFQPTLAFPVDTPIRWDDAFQQISELELSRLSIRIGAEQPWISDECEQIHLFLQSGGHAELGKDQQEHA